MTKKNKTPLGIFIESIGLYFSNFDKFVKYMTFPVLGQVAGLVLVLILTMFYTKHIPQIENFNILILLSILVTLPGLLIFTKAFWEYLIAYGAINSMLDNLLRSGKVYDFDAHTELIKRRSLPFVGLWFLFGFFSLLAIFPLLWVPAGVIVIFCVLTFQIFTYEPELSPIGCIKRSIQLIKGHFASTFMLIALVGALTYIFVPQIVNKIFEISNLTNILSDTLVPFVQELPIEELNSLLAYLYIPAIQTKDIAVFAISITISQILIQYTLPLRSILWGMWYKELNGSIPKPVEESKRKKKRPSEKLMEASKKKYSSKKLDRNILKRAMEKDED